MSAAAGAVLGFLLAVIYACIFHLIYGGAMGRFLLYLIVSLIGFALGHFVGLGLQFNMLKLGALHLLPATLGAVVALIIARWLWP